MAKLILPQNGAKINTQTDIQSTFIEKLRTEGEEKAFEWLLSVKKQRDLSAPREILIEWEPDSSENYAVEISETADFDKAEKYEVNEPRLSVTNLKVGQKYFVKINGVPSGNFETVDNGYRFIYLDGGFNIRDLGGINIKQGVIFRGGEMNHEYTLTDKGKKDFCGLLGIRTEINLREESSYDLPYSSAGEGVSYKKLPYWAYDVAFRDEQKERIVKIFDALSDEGNYPIYFHCQGGADRTGLIAMYLRALAGESDDDIITDYALTSLACFAPGGVPYGKDEDGLYGRTRSTMAEFIKLLGEKYAGDTLGEKLRIFLLDCGIKEETLTKVVNIIKK